VTLCVDETTGARMIAGELSAAEADLAHRHIVTCRDCEQFVVALVRASDGFKRSTEPQEPGSNSELAPESGEEDRAIASLPTAILGPRPRRVPAGERTLSKGTLVGRYVVLDRIGAGGMGVVYSAYDPDLNRKVALKLVRPRLGPDDQVRVLREAQALARLQHPNVVTLHDVGSFEERVFLAMELVDGTSLRGWWETGERSWREVVAVFIAAGEGLVAAHDKQLVHRDFKPANVLVGNDGRVRVTDFGLARGSHGEDIDVEWDEDERQAATPRTRSGPSARTAAPATRTPAMRASSRDLLGHELTQAGAVIGTPPYMAPETYRSEGGEAADQFAFAVSLYEALYRQLPFEVGATGDARWIIKKPPAARAVPAWLYKLVVRGLAEDSSQRFASMHELVAALKNDPRIVRRRIAIGIGAVAFLGAGVTFAITRPDSQESLVCQGAEQKLVGVWDAQKNVALRAGLVASGFPSAADAADRTSAVLDRYAAGWVRMHTETCQATRARGEQSEEILTLRMTCLERRRVDLEALTNLLAKPTAEQATKAVESAENLPRLSYCADIDALRAPVPPPSDAKLRARTDALYKELATAKLTLDIVRLDTIAKKVDALGWAPLAADTHFARCKILRDASQRDESLSACMQAITAALSGNDDLTLARAFTVRAGIFGGLGQIESGRQELLYAEAVTVRLGDEALKIQLMMTRAWLDAREDRVESAVAWADRAIAAADKSQRMTPLDKAAAYQNLGVIFGMLEHHDRSITAFRRAIELIERVQGPDSGELVEPLSTLAIPLARWGRLDEALKSYQRALRIAEQVYGAEHATVGTSLLGISQLLLSEGRRDEALAAVDRAAKIIERSYPEGHFYRGLIQVQKGLNFLNQLDFKRGAALLTEGMAILENQTSPDFAFAILGGRYALAESFARLGRVHDAKAWARKITAVPDGPGVSHLQARAYASSLAGDWQLHHGDRIRALALLVDGVARARALAAPSDVLVGSSRDLARAYVELGRWPEALALLEETLPRLQTDPLGGGVHLLRFDVRFLLARSLDAVGGDARRAAALAGEALAEVSRLSPYDLLTRQNGIDTWLAKHPPKSAADRTETTAQ